MSDILVGSILFTVIVLALSLIVIGARSILVAADDVTITVNAEKRFPAHAGLKLLGILTGVGIPLPSPCGGIGACGLCRVKVVEGGDEPLATEVDKLARSDLRDGVRLACQVVARGDLAVVVPDELFGVEAWECTVRACRSVAPFSKELILDLPGGKELEFHAGAFVQVTAPPYRLPFSSIEIAEIYHPIWEQYGLREVVMRTDRPVTRAYSLANTPADEGAIVLTVRLALPPPGAGSDAPPGLVSSYLFGVKPGDKLAVSGPYGDFRAHESEREMIFIGGGVGIAPLRAVIFEQLERKRITRKISFWYGVRTEAELFYADEFDDLQARHPNFSWTVAVSDIGPKEKWSGPVGFIHNVVFERYLENHPAPEECEYYLCGPPLMIKAVLAMLDDLGVDRDTIFNDDFGG